MDSKDRLSTETVIQNVPIQASWKWIKDSFNLLYEQPKAWLMISLAHFFILFLVAMIPGVGGLLSLMMMPILNAGFLYAAAMQNEQREFKWTILFEGFKSHPVQLGLLGVYVLGVIFLGVLILFLLISNLFDVHEMFANNPNLKENLATQLPQSLTFTGVLVFLLFGALLMFVLNLIIWLVPNVVIFRAETSWEAAKWSVRALIKNLLPLFVFSLLTNVLSFVFVVLPFLLEFTLGMMIGTIVWTPCFLISFFFAYCELFDDPQPSALLDSQTFHFE